MTAVAGQRPATPTTGGTTSAEAKSQTETLIRAARVIFDNCGISMGQSKVSRLVRTFQQLVERNGFALFDFLANAVQLDAQRRREALANPEIARVISYADPTGETAVDNVLRGRMRVVS